MADVTIDGHVVRAVRQPLFAAAFCLSILLLFVRW
jgi:hypothetical protein